MKIPADAVLSQGPDLLELIAKAMVEASRQGIKADSIVINENMVYVPELIGERPAMICGLDVYATKDWLPDGYSFAVLHNCNKEPKSQWIPVAERLPENHEIVLCYDGSYVELSTFFGGEFYDMGNYYSHVLFGITHWMHLPVPPVGE